MTWNIRGGYFVSGVYETQRERDLADAFNREHGKAIEKAALEAYRQGIEDGRALYAPKSWLGRLFG